MACSLIELNAGQRPLPTPAPQMMAASQPPAAARPSRPPAAAQAPLDEVFRKQFSAMQLEPQAPLQNHNSAYYRRLKNSHHHLYFQNALIQDLRSNNPLITHRTLQTHNPRVIEYLYETLHELSERSENIAPICKKIIVISRAILHRDYEVLGFQLSDSLSIAWFATASLHLARQKKASVLPMQLTGLTRTLHYLPKQLKLFVLTPPQQNLPVAEGLYKTVLPGLEISLTTPHKVRKIASAITKKISDPHDLKLIKRGLHIHKQLPPIKGVLSLISYAALPQIHPRDPPSNQLNIIYDWHEIALNTLIDTKQLQYGKPRIQIALAIAKALAAIHKNGIIHGDLKPDNILCTITNSREVKAVLCDFDLAFKAISGKPNFIMRSGYYGSFWYTAPELFGTVERRWLFDEYIQMEIWALGICFYELFSGTECPPQWAYTIHNDYNKNFNDEKTISKTALTAAQKAVNSLIKSTIEDNFRKIINKRNKNINDELQCIIFQMLRLHPRNRITLSQVCEQLEKLLEHAELA